VPWEGLLVVRILPLILVNLRELRNLLASPCDVVWGLVVQDALAGSYMPPLLIDD